MNNYERLAAFAARYGISVNGPDISGVIDALLYDMQLGLDCPQDSLPHASQQMIPTWTNPPDRVPKNETVIVIDAGGTNFRSCSVQFDNEGRPSIENLERRSMPGIEREYSKKEFFDTIASYLEHLKGKSAKIGFCFSYAMKITPENDGQVINFSKEIKAKEVIGSFVGASLSDALCSCGWEKPEKVVMLNDTAAALLAGASQNIEGKRFGSYAGLILGTGLNTAYIESCPIKKAQHSARTLPESQIVVCEAGMFDKLARSFFDTEYDKTTNTPGMYVLEKMCSGAYLGGVASLAVKTACKEGLFSEKTCKALSAVGEFGLYDMDRFLHTPYRTDTLLGAALAGAEADDYDMLYLLLDMFVDRCARLASSIIAAAVIKSGKGKNPSMPVSVLCEGTTFYKTHNLRARIMGYLNTELIQKRHLYCEIVTLDNAVVLGTALAAVSA